MFLVWPTKFEKYFEFYAKLICCLKKKKMGDCLKSKFLGELGFNLGFVKIISSHTHAFFSMLWGEVTSNSVDFQNFFLQFQSIESVFRSIEIAIKISMSLYLFRLIETVFQSIKYCESIFFKIQCLTCSKHFFKSFFNFSLSLSDSAKQNHPIFVVFLRIFCKVFLSQSQ